MNRTGAPGTAAALLRHGADIVVPDLAELLEPDENEKEEGNEDEGVRR
ncbi:hypothetical protein ACWD4G_07935 [Streptomyces sp. NPDC002643]